MVTEYLPTFTRDAFVYYMALKEFSLINLHLTIKIEAELDKATLEKYCEHVHATAFCPSQPEKVKELVGDGHQQIMMK